MNNGVPQGIGVGVGNIDVLKGTDIGVLRDKGSYDKSTYKKTTKPDGTVVEEVKMNQRNKNVGVVDLETQGVNIGDWAVDVGISEKSTEDAVGFVDSIWGSRQAAGMIQNRRAEEVKLEQFKAQRELQLQEDSVQRRLLQEQMLQQQNGVGKFIMREDFVNAFRQLSLDDKRNQLNNEMATTFRVLNILKQNIGMPLNDDQIRNYHIADDASLSESEMLDYIYFDFYRIQRSLLDVADILLKNNN